MKKILLSAVCTACLIGYPGGSVKAVNNSDNPAQSTKQAKKNKQLNLQKQNLQANSQAATRPQLASPVATLNHNLLANKIDGQLTLKVDLGYVLQFSRKLDKSYQDGNADSTSLGTASGFGYGASFGYTSNKKWGLSFDYLGFNRKWQDVGHNYNASYNIITLTPSYRFSLDKKNEWGIRLGLGLGVAVSDVRYSGFSQATSGTAIRTDIKNPDLTGACPFYTDANGLKPGDTVANAPVSVRPELMTTVNVSAANLPSGNIGPNRCVLYNPMWYLFRDGGPYKAAATPPASGQPASPVTPSSPPPPASTPPSTPLPPSVSTPPSPASPPASPATTSDSSLAAPWIPNDNTAGTLGGTAMVLAPQISVEYDNGYFHADINARYIAALQKFNYANKDEKNNIKYNTNPGSLAFFVGAGLGINF